MQDAELLHRYKESGNSNWLGVLLERYTLLLFGVCMKYLKNEEDAKDGVQQIFLKAINELDKYEVTYFKSWLYIIAKNYCLIQLRNAKNISALEMVQEVKSVEEVDKNHFLEKELDYIKLSASLAELRPEQQQCITLFYLEKKSYQQIMDATGFSQMQVKSHIQNGKRNLKLLMERKQK